MNNIPQSLLSTCIATSSCRFPVKEHLADEIALCDICSCEQCKHGEPLIQASIPENIC